MVGSVVGGLAKGAVSFGLSKLLGGGDSGVGTGSNQITSSVFGNDVSFLRSPGGGLQIRREPGRETFLNRLVNSGTLAANRIGNLRGPAGEGLRRLTNLRVRANERARERSVGNLRDNLARRRVLGSSFGQDALTRADLAFAEAEDEIRAESFLQEIDLSLNLIKEQNDTFQQAIAQMLDAGEFETTAAINFANGTSAAQSRISDSLSRIAVANAQGRGKLIGGVADAVGQGVGKIFDVGNEPGTVVIPDPGFRGFS